MADIRFLLIMLGILGMIIAVDTGFIQEVIGNGIVESDELLEQS